MPEVTIAELAKMFDHSLLQPVLTDADLEKGCAVAREYGAASVCIKPYAVGKAAQCDRDEPSNHHDGRDPRHIDAEQVYFGEPHVCAPASK